MKRLFKSKWSNWIDLSIGTFSHETYLLQGRRKTNGKVQFKVRSSGKAYYAPDLKMSDIEAIKPIDL